MGTSTGFRGGIGPERKCIVQFKEFEVGVFRYRLPLINHQIYRST